MSPDFHRPRRNSSVRLPLWALGLLLIAGLIFLTISSVWLFRTVRNMASAPEAVAPEFDPLLDQSTLAPADAVLNEDQTAEEVAPLEDVPVVEAWAGTENINLLILGVDLRCEEEGPTHSDTLMVATIDPVGHTAAILSIPRDLWVEVPGFGVSRINQAYFNGQAYDFPGGGPQLAADTVEAFLGVPIDYYVAVDFQAFVDAVDLVGGIVVDVPEAIDDPSYPDNCYGYDPFSIAAGRHRMDGQTALKYARTRATLGGDVDRAGRQQQVVLAAQDQVTQLDNLPELLIRAPQLWQTYRENVSTNLELDEVLQLARLVRDIPRDSIKSVVVGYDYVYNETTPDGQQVLIPAREKIRALRDELFSPAPVPTPAQEDLPELMAAEEARIAIHNGTAQFGLAADTQETLSRFNFNVTEIDNADSAGYTSTQIIDYGSHPATTRFLVQIMEIPPLNVSTGSNPPGDYDVLVILGSDQLDP